MMPNDMQMNGATQLKLLNEQLLVNKKSLEKFQGFVKVA
jgi:hypothetical protein